MTAPDNGEGGGAAQADRAMAGIARSGAASLVGSGVSAICQFVVVLVVTRFYPSADAGALFAATATFLVVMALVQLGADQGLVRFIAWHRARGEHEIVDRLVRTAVVPVLVASLIGAGVLSLVADPLSSMFAEGSGDLVAGMLRSLAAAVPLAALHEVFLAGTRGFGTMRPTIMIERVLRPVLQPVAIVVVGLAGAEAGALALAWAAPYIAAVALSGLALRQRVRSAGRRTLGERHESVVIQPLTESAVGRVTDLGPPRSLGRQFWSFAVARGAARACQVALQRSDIILVAALVSTSAAAVYTAATRFIALGQLVNQAVQQVIQPRLAALLSRHEYANAQHVVRRSTLWLTTLAWPGYLALVALAPLLMSIFGSDYVAGASSVIVLALAMMAATAAGPVDVVLLMAGRSGASLASVVVALVVDVVGCLLLLPTLGILGAAVAWAAAIVARNAITIALAHRLVRITAWSSELGVVSVVAIACLAVVPVPLAIWRAPDLVVIGAMALGAAAYALVVWRRRERLGGPGFAGMLRRRTAGAGKPGQPAATDSETGLGVGAGGR